LQGAADVFDRNPLQPRIDKLRTHRNHIDLAGDQCLGCDLRVEKLQGHIESVFFKNTGFLRDPQRSERAARLGIGDRKVAFFRLSAELRGAGEWKSEEDKNNSKPNPVSPLPPPSALFCPSHIFTSFFRLDIR
jgi:hypothetical protein